MSPRVRPATIADAAEWLRMRIALWPDQDRADLEGELGDWLRSPRTAVFVCEREGGGLAGFLEAALRNDAEGCVTSPVGFVEGWYVDADRRGQGVGALLIEAAERWAVSLGCREMASDSLLENVDGHAAHRAVGYEEVERIVCFRKALGAPPPTPERLVPGPPGRRPVVGIMGAGESASADDVALARRLGELVAREGWVLLTGGRDAGVMAAASRGAKRVAGSLTVGVLPSAEGGESPHLDVALFTGLGNARNAINVLSSDVVVACGHGGPGTASETALALKCGKPVLLLAPPPEAEAFFRTLGGSLAVAESAEDAIATIVREGWIHATA